MEFNNYLNKRLKGNPKLSKTIWEGYDDFKIGVVLKEARENAGLTQDDLAKRIHTTKSVISRIENHAEDIRLSTLEKVANAIGKKLKISIL